MSDQSDFEMRVMANVTRRLCELLNSKPQLIIPETEDALVRVGEFTFSINVKRQFIESESLANLARETQQGSSTVIPVVAVEYLNDAGRALARKYGVGIIDTLGNVDIAAKNLRLLVMGVRAGHHGRQVDVFYGAAGKVMAAVTAKPSKLTRADLARALASRFSKPAAFAAVGRLLEIGYVTVDLHGRVEPTSMGKSVWLERKIKSSGANHREK